MQKIIYLEKREGEEPAPEGRPASAIAGAETGAVAGSGEEERIEAAVRWINTKVQSTVHFGLIQIGYYLLGNFFAGSIEEALSRNPHKQQSFRKLCKRGDLVISSTHLVSAVKLVVQEKQLADERAFQALAVSHKIALLGLRDLGARRELARRVESERLSVRALNREVRALRGAAIAAAAPAAADRWARRLRRALDTVFEATEEATPEGISPREAAALDRAILEARRRLQNSLASLRGIRSVAV